MRTYRIIRNERTRNSGPKGVNTIVAIGIEGYEVADLRCKQFQSEEDAAHPGLSSWVRTMFFVEMEGGKYSMLGKGRGRT